MIIFIHLLHFERLAKIQQWSDAEQTLLMHCVLTGKSQEVFSALSKADSENYETVKQAVLQTYQLVPEAYRQKFRTSQKQQSQTYVEFVGGLRILSNRWQVASGVSTFEQLGELVLLGSYGPLFLNE